jgi:uncharacterized protein RhaS with RHS repeats
VQVAGSRYYNPGLGRWTARDPIGERGGTNLAAFLRNSCPNQSDPYGLEPKTCQDLYSRILSEFDKHADVPPTATSADLVTPDLVLSLDYDGPPTPHREKAVLILKMTVQCQPKDGGPGFTRTFYGTTSTMAGTATSVNPGPWIGSLDGLQKKLYLAGFNNTPEQEASDTECKNCKCRFWGERSAIVHGHSSCHQPSVWQTPGQQGDNNYETKEKSWVLYECPKNSGTWFRQGWEGNVLHPREQILPYAP